MTDTLIKIDFSKTPEQHPCIHNRWHPNIPMIAWVKPGDDFKVECVDWTGGQIHNNDSADDVRDVDLTKVHYLSGPIGVEGVEPGDLLVGALLHIGTLPKSESGFNGFFSRENFAGRGNVLPVWVTPVIRAGTKVRSSCRA